MGCLDKIGCAALLAVGVAAGAWYFSDQVPDRLRRLSARAAHTVAGRATALEDRLSHGEGDSAAGARTGSSGAAAGAATATATAKTTAPATATAPAIAWVPLDSTRPPDAAVARLAGRDAPAYVTIGASGLARMLAPGLLPVLQPRGAASRSATVTPQVALVDHTMHLRAVVDLREVAGTGALRTLLSAVVRGQDTVDATGTLTVEQPGLGRYTLQSVQVRGITVPSAAWPLMVRAIRQRAVWPADTLGDALQMPLPRSVADLRLTQGRAVLYRAVQP